MIKVGFLLSYDYEFVKNSLPCVYDHADTITFSLDRRRMSWSGNPFKFDESILDWIRAYDTQGKIRIYEDDFCIEGHTPMQNDTYQRNKMAEFMGKGGWHVQIDSDEYFINFKGFVAYLKSIDHYLKEPEKNQVCITVDWFNLFKQDRSGFFYIRGSYTPARVATNYPAYNAARRSFQRQIFTPFVMVHQSWARSEQEIYYKMNNWGHRDDIDPEAYFRFWKNINKDNYSTVRNFAPGHPASTWHTLGFVPAQTVQELLRNFDQLNYRTPRLQLFRKNFVQFFLRSKKIASIYFKLLYNNEGN